MKLALPSGRTIECVTRGSPRARACAPDERSPDPRRPLFADMRELFARGEVTLRSDRGDAIAPGSLALGDFHALRAILTRLGWLHEEPVDLTCRNCGAPFTHRPCAALPLGPFEDGELHDPELDHTVPFGEPHDLPELGAAVLSPLTADQALPLHAALARPSLRVTPGLVRAMGIASLAGERAPSRIAPRLSRASDAAFGALTDLFLSSHYPPRLFSIAVCAACGARNDVDAPYDREFDPAGAGEESRDRPPSNGEAFPSFAEFDRAAHAVAARVLSGAEAREIALVVDGGVPACDDGGEPLLGSYVPGYAGDMAHPSRAPEITVFFRTFRAIWDEEGAYDWRAELDETIAHELEHHRADLLGDDPVDDHERAEIAHEQARVLGKKALMRGEVRAMSADFIGFLRRTWPIWLLLLLATLAGLYADVR